MFFGQFTMSLMLLMSICQPQNSSAPVAAGVSKYFGDGECKQGWQWQLFNIIIVRAIMAGLTEMALPPRKHLLPFLLLLLLHYFDYPPNNYAAYKLHYSSRVRPVFMVSFFCLWYKCCLPSGQSCFII